MWTGPGAARPLEHASMDPSVSVDLLSQARPRLRDLVQAAQRRLPAARYLDLRLEVRQEKRATAENGQEKASADDVVMGLCARAIAGRRSAAPGYHGQVLGAADMLRLEAVAWEALRHAHARALASARHKAQVRGRTGALGKALQDTALAPVPPQQDTVPAQCRVDPREVPLRDVLGLAVEASKAARAVQGVAYTLVTAQASYTRELVLTSEGADVEQSFAMAEGLVFVVADGAHGPYELYDFTGHQRGWEVLTEGCRVPSIALTDLVSFAHRLAADARELADAPPLRPPDGEVVVVTDPHYNALVVHEVVGHPSELDRALKYETSYAGRSWLLRDLEHNQVGRPVASPLVSAFSDPTIEGFGSYRYDHEATPGRRVDHIRGGVYHEFLNNRQTAALVGQAPNGAARATEGYLVPLIRMNNTVFGPGDRDPQDILAEVEQGYYVAGHRIPSVAESRENFRISAVRVYEVRQGRLGRLYRDGAVLADTRDYFMRVDAVGNDLRMFPIPNCGKGQPMQAKRMSNGGPTMRTVARLAGTSR